MKLRTFLISFWLILPTFCLAEEGQVNPIGKAVCVGLNHVSADHYAGWEGFLSAAESDAERFAEIASGRGFDVVTLQGKSATRSAVVRCLVSSAEKLRPGDFLLFYFAGMGGIVPDLDSDESDFEDETLCLFDGQLVDDEMRSIVGSLPDGIRVVFILDTSHPNTTRSRSELRQESPPEEGIRLRVMPSEIARLTYSNNADFYDSLVVNRHPIRSSVIILKASSANQLSAENRNGGRMTAALVALLETDTGADYHSLLQQLSTNMPAHQKPSLHFLGEGCERLMAQRPISLQTEAAPDWSSDGID